MFKQVFLDKSKKTAIFLVIYTILFVLFFSTLSYTLPFVLAFAISIFTRPLNKFIQRKTKLSNGVSAAISTFLIILVIALVFSVIFFKVVKEVRLLLDSFPNIDTIINYIDSAIHFLDKKYDILNYSRFDFNFLQKFNSQISTVITSTLNITKFVMNKTISFVAALPVILMVTFITFLSTYFFSKDMPNIESRFLAVFSSSGRFKVRRIVRESRYMLFGYVKSYACLLSLSFAESFLGFTLLRIDYAFMLSVLATFLDFLPIVGVGTVYMPLALYFFLIGNKFNAIALVIMFIVVTIVRQIVEPKLMSTNLGIHPVLILSSLFIGLKVYGLIGVFYFLGIVILYNIFNKVEMI